MQHQKLKTLFTREKYNKSAKCNELILPRKQKYINTNNLVRTIILI